MTKGNEKQEIAVSQYINKKKKKSCENVQQ